MNLVLVSLKSPYQLCRIQPIIVPYVDRAMKIEFDEAAWVRI